MSYYHIEGNGGFKNLPERILVREDGYLGAYKFYGEPIVDYWYVPEAENEKLREQLEYDRQTSRSRLERIDQLNAENAKLRQQLADVTESMGRVEERCAKLRELAKKLKACNSSCGRCIELYGKCDYEAELRELGIEVDA